MKTAIFMILAVLATIALAAQPVKQNQFECDACHFTVHAIENWLQEDETQIDARLDLFCKVVGKAYTPVCDALFNYTVDEIVKFLEEYEQPEKLCLEIKLCDSVVVPTPVEVSPFECSACKLIVGKIEQYVEQQKTEQEILAELEKGCALLKSQVCTMIIETYLDQILQWIENEEPADKICQQIKMCDAVSAPITPVKDNGIECAACEFLVGKIEQWVASGSTEQQIIAEIENVCKWINSDVCNQIIENFLPQIIQWLEQQETPATICQQISMCDSSMQQYVQIFHDMYRQRPVQEIKANPFECATCKLIVGKIENWIESNATEEEILAELQKGCLKLKSQVCTMIVTQYLDSIFELLAEEEPADKICAQITFCAVEAKPVTPVKDGIECAACEFVVGKVEQWVASGSTEAQITAEIKNICKWINSDVCDQIVDSFVPQIIQWVEQKESPATICAQLSMCGSSAPITPVQDGGLECAACEFLVGKIEQWVASGSTEQQIIAEIENVCTWISSDVCNQIIENFLPQIIQWLEQQETPATICGQISMC